MTTTNEPVAGAVEPRRHIWERCPLLSKGEEWCVTCNLIRNATSDDRPCKGPQKLRKMEGRS